jgi:hypothetical protein
MTKSELAKLKSEIESELRAVETLLARHEEPRAQSSKAIIKAVADTGKRPSQCAEEIILGMPADFEIYDVLAGMQTALGRKGVYFGDIARQAIHLLRQRGQIETVIKGRGSRSGVYRVKK